MKICPKCNEKFDSGKFCKFCGTALQDEVQELYCSNCGVKLDSGAKFCPNCGAKIGHAVSLNPETLDLEHLEKYSLTSLVHLIEESRESSDEMFGEGKWGTRLLGYINKLDISDYLKEEEKTHDAILQDYIAEKYEFGDCGAEKDGKKYKYWLEKSAEQGYVEALYWLGNHLLGNVSFVEEGVFEKDVSKGLKILTEIVDSKNPRYLGDAATDLGHYYLRESNEKEAFKYYTIGANNNDRAGCLHLGFMYRDGEAVEPDEEKAFSLFKKAADLGNYYGKLQMAYCYEDGTGTEPDEEKAIGLFEEILENCDDDLKGIAAQHIGSIYYNNQNYSKAISYYKLAADNGSEVAMFYLGWCYFVGQGTFENKETAFKWFLKGAEADHAESQRMVGICYKCGDGVKEDVSKAIDWFEKAIENGSSGAAFDLGEWFWEESDYKDDGLQLIQQSAHDGNVNAQEWLQKHGYGA